MLKNQKHVFWEALIITVFIFGIGVLFGIFIEHNRANTISEMYLRSEINLLDVKIQTEILDLKDLNCRTAIQKNIEFGDRIYKDALTLERYESASRITDDLKEQHRRYDVLRALFWLNSIKIKEKCRGDFHTVVYLYDYGPEETYLKNEQFVFSRFLSELKEEYGNEIKTIGYMPKRFPSDVVIDKRYSVVHQTKGKDFSVMEAIQYWYDLMKSGIDPSRVKLIGINGGGIAAFEFHAAIVFGAQVGIMRNTGRSASELINDPSWEESTGPEYGNKPKKLFKVLRNTREDIFNFLTKPFIIDPEIETIQKLLIQHRESGSNMFELNFTTEDVDNTILSGFLTALDHIASEALNVGEILSIKFKDGYMSGGLFTNGEFKVVFLLNETPPPTLEEKIINFIKQVEDKLGEQFHKLHLGCQGYTGGKEMNNILSGIFGVEILKLIDIKIEQEPTEILQVPE